MQVVSTEIKDQMASASWIRKMFEKGIELKKKVGADKVFDFSLGNPDIPPPAKLRDAMISLADEVVKPMGVGYCPNSGFPPFRAELAKHLAAQQEVPLSTDNVVVTCGAAGALTSFFRATIEPGDEVICPAPYFVEYGSYCGHFGGVLKPIPSLAPDFPMGSVTSTNGIPFAWFDSTGIPRDPSGDPDADEFNNRAEYRAGTDPLDLASHPAAPTVLFVK